MDLSIFKNEYPWAVGVKTKEVVKKIKGEAVSLSTGELLGSPAVIEERVYDNEKFTKVYQKLIKAKYGFKPATQRIVDFIIANLPQNEPVIALDLEALTSYFRGLKHDIKVTKAKQIMSRQTFSLALKELVDNDVIAPTGLGAVYYINANLIHNGSRVVLVSVIRRNDADKTSLSAEQIEREKLEESGQIRIDD